MGTQRNSYFASENARWNSHSGKLALCENLNVHLPFDLAIKLLGICPRELKAYVHTKTGIQIFIAVIFLTAPNWKQYLSAAESVTTMLYYLQSGTLQQKYYTKWKEADTKTTYCMILLIFIFNLWIQRKRETKTSC